MYVSYIHSYCPVLFIYHYTSFANTIIQWF
ncbi:protein FAM135 [Staphylococcus haemolyticus]|uniref:Protein FAM135 n=1 Tax=Staphylococcus haemolyticus TaxID=1283 RepID=A0AB38PBB1_STAHA|nr:protein FAM135 [Staphylococcus sp. GDX7P312P]KAA2281922.1 protein FAM135 [Staphylococcus sp. GDX7P459A]MWF63827.1 protein FAM135 [Staphylococcus haemolyticus]PTK40515.1 hypothetical protein BUZ38_09070 [Staphylococcus haemolyticus]PTK48983.1 hypothetical protein BUZ43_04810 [Staphylococcus haemolyticus]